MKGDSIVIEKHHRAAAAGICEILLPVITTGGGKFVITVAGESGSGKSETAAAIAERLAQDGVDSFIFQQDDYFVHPPKSNDRVRREDIGWVGPQEVKLDLMDEHLAQFRAGAVLIDKPLDTRAGGLFHRGRDLFGSDDIFLTRDDPGYRILNAFIDGARAEEDCAIQEEVGP